ncbi:MAG: response regulator transcription factor [Burkholderiaceae bacterium]|jgi:DNA-binding response OmpR family regulator|nr:response regulator transcription factor [Burkholderiaceae bacterium]MCC6173358.1 response regulator transcription factor [Gammaproteobacteria bacterium]HMN63477.1 response regulator transcription factor [Burkholderiaceae bacterium]
MRVLIVEDDPLLADGLTRTFNGHGFVADTVDNGRSADILLERDPFDLVVLDVGLPGIDGFEVARRARQRGSTVPILMLTARDAVHDRVHGLNVGADDYVQKPFDKDELLARAHALVRRSRAQRHDTISHGRLVMDCAARRCFVDGAALDLPPREWLMLEYLLRNVERVVNKRQIVAAMCRWDEDMSDNAVEVYVSRLRAKLEPHGIRIRTVRGFGYMLQAVPGEAH